VAFLANALPFLQPGFTGCNLLVFVFSFDSASALRALWCAFSDDARLFFTAFGHGVVFVPQCHWLVSPDHCRFNSTAQFGHVAFDQADFRDPRSQSRCFLHEGFHVLMPFQMFDQNVAVDAGQFPFPFVYQMRRAYDQNYLVVADVALQSFHTFGCYGDGG